MRISGPGVEFVFCLMKWHKKEKCKRMLLVVGCWLYDNCMYVYTSVGLFFLLGERFFVYHSNIIIFLSALTICLSILFCSMLIKLKLAKGWLTSVYFPHPATVIIHDLETTHSQQPNSPTITPSQRIASPLF